MLEDVVRSNGRSRNVNRTLGDDLLTTTAINSANGIYGVFRQLVGNSYDADATHVDIKVTDRTIDIIDDGHGMSESEVETKWLKSGDSSKVALMKSPKGRPYLGHFGIASASIINIANQYTLRTAKEAEMTELTEIVGDGLSVKKKLELKSATVHHSLHGTELHISDLKFIQGPRFSIDGLINYLSMTLPIGDHTGLSVSVNGRAVKSTIIENARVFRFDKTGKLFGHAHGLIYLTNREREDAGIYVRVRGEAQSDPNKVLNIDKINSRMAPKLVAILDADGLKKSCRLNRDSFNNTPAFNEFLEVLGEELRLVSRFADQISESSRAGRNKVKIGKQLSVLCGDFNKAKLPEVPYDTKFKERPGHPDDFVVAYQPDAKTFWINNSNPQITGAPNKPFVYYVMVHGVAEAIAAYRVSRNPGSDFRKVKADVLNQLARGQKPASLGVSDEIVSNAYYKPMELIKALRLPGPGVQYFVDHQFLVSCEHGILGQDVISMQSRINGYVPLPNFVRDNISTQDYGQSLANIQLGLSTAGDKIYTFAIDPTGGKKCHFIEPVLIKPLATMMQGLLDSGETHRIGEELEKFGERYLAVTDISVLLGRKDMTDIILFEKLGFEVRTQGKNSNEKYHFADCVKAMQIYREAVKPAIAKN